MDSTNRGLWQQRRGLCGLLLLMLILASWTVAVDDGPWNTTAGDDNDAASAVARSVPLSLRSGC